MVSLEPFEFERLPVTAETKEMLPLVVRVEALEAPASEGKTDMVPYVFVAYEALYMKQELRRKAVKRVVRHRGTYDWRVSQKLVVGIGQYYSLLRIASSVGHRTGARRGETVGILSVGGLWKTRQEGKERKGNRTSEAKVGVLSVGDWLW